MKINKNKVLICMARKGMTYKTMAEEYGCSRQYINIILSKGSVKPVTAGKIARILGCDVTEIIDL
jgi:DNA-binding Xre family transcriptional regulator